MEAWALTVYLAAASVALLVSLLLVLQNWEHRRYARSALKDLDRFQPVGRARIIAPCKGLDVGLEDNLRALVHQDYRDYEVVFVVETDEDPACAVVRRVMAENPQVPAQLLVAGRARAGGQKVHNLRAATAVLPAQIEYLAFVDSDAGPRPEWLRVLVGRLSRGVVGAVTGYRWFLPARPSLANHILYSINSGVMALFGRTSHGLVWGGSWAVSRDVFDAMGLHPAWEGTLSDDLMASRLLRRSGLPVRFEPAAVVASPLDYSFGEMLGFLRRQYLIGRFYARSWWILAVFSSTLFNAVWLATLGSIVLGAVRGTPPLALSVSICLALYGLNVVRAWLRQDLIGTYFPDRQAAFARARRWDLWAGPLAGLVNGLGILGSMVGRHLRWRGVRYRMSARGRVYMIHGDGPALDSDHRHAGRSARGRADNRGRRAALPAVPQG